MASVAVIGAGTIPLRLFSPFTLMTSIPGPQGIAALKNLREQGFDAVCFEKQDYIGGAWQFSEDRDVTSVLRSRSYCAHAQCSLQFDVILTE